MKISLQFFFSLFFQLLDTLFGFFARKTDLYTSPNVGEKPEELILKAFHKWEKVALDKHKKEKAERDEVSDYNFNHQIFLIFFLKG